MWVFPKRFQSTLPARGATEMSSIVSDRDSISIHAPCTGSDMALCCVLRHNKNFNPRSLHGERRPSSQNGSHGIRFQSTLPARGATVSRVRGGGNQVISIHAPCTGSDPIWRRMARKYCSFQYTLPARGATKSRMSRWMRTRYFNPRSLHGERQAATWEDGSKQNFNPRSLHGERLNGAIDDGGDTLFQSTLPARGATAWFLAHAEKR